MFSSTDAFSIVSKVYNGKLSDHRLTYGQIHDLDGTIIDEVMATYMQSPQSYTKEDMVEVYGHGGQVVIQGVLKAILTRGARVANPGEFTLRAFLNGRMDLTQAEAVADIIQAKTETSLRLALDGVLGRLGEPIRRLRTELMGLLAYLTARIDFPEDDIKGQDPLASIRKASKDIKKLIASADTGIIYRHGVRVAIVGRPNVGKSSILNKLLGKNRAIVTTIAGTTRDTVEELVSIQSIPFVLIESIIRI